MSIPQSTIAELEKAAQYPISECPSLLHLLCRIVKERPNFPMFQWADHDVDYYVLTAQGFWNRIDHVYKEIKGGVCADLPPGSRVMLLHDNYREALLLLWAFWKADYRVMLLANRNSAAGFAELKRVGGIEAVFTTEKLAHLLGDLQYRIVPQKFPLSVNAPPCEVECRPPRADEIQESPLCLHTSGSTAYPKPVWLSNYYNLQVVYGLPADNYDRLDNPRRCMSLAPLYHALGFFSHVALATSGALTVVMPPGETFPPKPSLTLKTLAMMNLDYMSCAPALLESLVTATENETSPELKQVLQKIPLLTYGGAHMPKSMLQRLQDSGLHIGSGYGSTETGILMDSAQLKEHPQAMKLKPHRIEQVLFVPLDDEPDAYRLVLKGGYMGTTNLPQNDANGFDTGDLFRKGPEEGTWVFYGRSGDVVVQVNGEKTNALGIELAVAAADPALISACFVFGQQKPTVGILVEVIEEVARHLSPMEVVSRVRRAVAITNQESPTQSRILENMIWILPLDKQLPMTPKRSLKRRDALAMFTDVIESLYSKAESPEERTIVPRNVDLREIVTAAVREVMGGSQVRPNISLFDQGLSSQQVAALLAALRSKFHTKLKPETLYELSTVDALASFLQRESAETASSSEATAEELASLLSHILNLPKEGLLTALYETNLFDLGLTSQLAIQLRSEMQDNFHKHLPSNLLYENPTLKDLVEWLTHRVPAAISASVDPKNTRGALEVLDKCYERIDQMEIGLPDFQSEDESLEERVYLLTGSTGALGGQILTKLALEETTKKIYCLIRNGGSDRLVKALEEHRLDTAFITCKDSLIECLPIDLKDKHLGMDVDIYKRVRREVTDVIHSAWKMDFNQRVQDFAPDCLESLLNLIHFCSVSDKIEVSQGGRHIKAYKKRLYFISSVSAIAGYAAVVDQTRRAQACSTKQLQKQESFPGGGDSSPTLASSGTEVSCFGDLCIDIPERFLGSEQLSMAVPMGYGQSKFIAEAICDRARERLGLSAYVVRCGQLSGDSHSGVWNTKELVSLLTVAGACDLGVLPDIALSSEFVPMDVAGAAVVDIVQAAATTTQMVYHIANPHGGTWKGWASALREAGIQFELVSSSEFGKQLALHSDNRCQVLASFLEKILREPDHSVVTCMKTSQTCQVSEQLRKCPEVDGKLAKVYLDYWRSVGFLKTQ